MLRRIIDINEGASEIRLVDIDKYHKEYSSGVNTDNWVDLKAEFKECCFDGVEFFMATPVGVKKSKDGVFETIKSTDHDFSAFPVGKVPYEWIEFVDLKGDEYHNFPLIFCKFKGLPKDKFQDKTPYKDILYYKEQSSGHLIEIKI